MLAIVLFCYGGESIHQKLNTSKLEQNIYTLPIQKDLRRITKKCMGNNKDA
jgi:hypothetical protein